ncbi:FCD domain-containing protein [Sphingosinicella sp. LHD-64]|uniref:FadR/GntR family transcriptional regulator n=1 Tax=Sphingosinicella sp. LHD-64 TaxID=3072139 RepID=UPI00280D3650|nr:FCD domain-containing protein [Sphingosinicella sp. LHD-64]MDQ8757559.1 FCD domain-containing protein [Sphingosinicella sp. LHD-64]
MARGKEKAAARVAQEIVQTIYDEGLKPGDRYLSEADALARHGVSRATFREALRFLEFQGVVKVRAGPGGGAIVQKPDWPHLASTFALLLQFAGAPLSTVMAARAAIEPSMAEAAARNASEAAIAELGTLLAEAEAAIADPQRFGPAYRAFWTKVADATGNALMAMLWPALRMLIDSGGFIPNERYRASLIARMRTLLACIESRDAAGAATLVAELDGEFATRLAELYPRRVGRVVAWSDLQTEPPAQPR